MPGVLVADKMGLGKTITPLAAAMICNLLTEKVVMGLLLSIVWENSLREWANIAQNDYPRIIGIDWEWYPLQRLNPVPRRLLEIHTTPTHGHQSLTSAIETILVVTMPRGAETFNSVIDEMTYGND